MRTASPLVAARMTAALARQTWSFGGADDDCGRLFLLANGRATLRCGSEPEAAAAAPAMIWAPRPTRGRLEAPAGADGYVVSVRDGFLQRVVTDPLLAVHRQAFLGRALIVPCDAARLPSLTVSFEALVEESRALEAGAVAAMGLHLGVLLLQLWRGAGLQEGCGTTAPGRSGETTVQRFLRLIELHYREGVPISGYASRLGVSQAHLHDACSRVAGRSPLALVHGRLLEEASARLEQTELSVEQVGFSLGFRDPGYFNRFFKRLSGQSPGAFRRGAGSRRASPPASFAAWP